MFSQWDRSPSFRGLQAEIPPQHYPLESQLCSPVGDLTSCLRRGWDLSDESAWLSPSSWAAETVYSALRWPGKCPRVGTALCTSLQAGGLLDSGRLSKLFQLLSEAPLFQHGFFFFFFFFWTCKADPHPMTIYQWFWIAVGKERAIIDTLTSKLSTFSLPLSHKIISINHFCFSGFWGESKDNSLGSVFNV